MIKHNEFNKRKSKKPNIYTEKGFHKNYSKINQY